MGGGCALLYTETARRCRARHHLNRRRRPSSIPPTKKPSSTASIRPSPSTKTWSALSRCAASCTTRPCRSVEKAGRTVGFYEQRRYLPEIRTELPEYKGIHSQVLQNVIERVDKTFQGFFRRVKQGQTPGYPRFKGQGRYDSFTFPWVYGR